MLCYVIIGLSFYIAACKIWLKHRHLQRGLCVAATQTAWPIYWLASYWPGLVGIPACRASLERLPACSHFFCLDKYVRIYVRIFPQFSSTWPGEEVNGSASFNKLWQTGPVVIGSSSALEKIGFHISTMPSKNLQNGYYTPNPIKNHLAFIARRWRKIDSDNTPTPLLNFTGSKSA